MDAKDIIEKYCKGMKCDRYPICKDIIGNPEPKNVCVGLKLYLYGNNFWKWYTREDEEK